MHWTKLSSAPDNDDPYHRFRVTHRFHPLFGREYDLLTYRHNWGEDRVYFHDETGALRSLPASWTSAAAEDPFVVAAVGRSHFRTVDLRELADLLRGMGS